MTEHEKAVGAARDLMAAIAEIPESKRDQVRPLVSAYIAGISQGAMLAEQAAGVRTTPPA